MCQQKLLTLILLKDRLKQNKSYILLKRGAIKNMSLLTGIGISKDKNSLRASREAAFLAKTQTKQEEIDLAIVFNTVDYDAGEVLKGIHQILGGVKVIGCTGAGIITNLGIQKDCLAIAVIKSDDIKFGLGASENINTKIEREAGHEIAREALNNLGSYHRHVFMMFSDGLIKNNSELIRGAQDALGRSFPLVSAASSDDFTFTRTYQYYNNRVLENGAVAILLGGDITWGLGVKHGWKPLGRPRIATKTEGNIIKTIDNKQAVNIYKDYFGKEIEELHKMKLARMAVLYPIGIFIPGEEEYLLRNALDVTDDGSLICQGEVPEGSEIRLMIGNKESCLDAARQAAIMAKESLRGKIPKLVIVFDSIARNKLLGRQAGKEISIIKEILGWDVAIIGFYTYGEGAPLKSLDYRGESYLHNETIAILTMAD